MNSHIQLPKCVLKQFVMQEGKNKGKFYTYKINDKNDKFELDTPKSFNTSLDYYMEITEAELSKKVERPLGNLIKFINSSDFNKDEISFYTSHIESIYNYMYALLCRSNKMPIVVKNSMIFGFCYNEEDLRDVAVLQGLEEAKKMNLFKDYEPTFFVNKTQVPFVLPQCGMFGCITFGSIKEIYVLLTGNLSVRLIEKRVLRDSIKDGSLVVKSCEDEKIIEKLNSFAYIHQKKLGEGYVISSNQNALRNAILEGDKLLNSKSINKN